MKLMKYTDVHAHVFPDDVAPKVVEQLEGYYKMHWHGNGTFADLNKSIDEAGIGRTVIFSTATKPTQVETINNYISSLCRDNNRFIGFGTMHPDYQDIEKEIARFPLLGLKGLKLHPDFQGFNIDDPRMFPIYKAVGSSMPILIHVGDENSDFSAPRRLAAVLDAMPDLVFIAAHFGGYCRWEEAKEYLIGRRNLYIDTSSCFHKFSFEFGRELTRLHGADRVLFASDYPAVRQSEAVEHILKMELTPEENEMIFHLNAEKLLGI